MRINNFILCMMFVGSYCVAQTKEISSSFNGVKTKEIHFEKLSFEELKAKAKRENKLIFINVYLTSCIPCKSMEKDVFTDAGVADYYNPNFINGSYDYSGKEGSGISEIYEVQCFPNFLFMDGDGKIVHRRVGGMNQEDFVKLAEAASNPKQRLLYFEEEYPKKKSDPDFILNYLRILDKASCFPLVNFMQLAEEMESLTKRSDLLKEYFAFQTEEMLVNRTNWNAIRDFTYDYRSREFSYLLKNAATYKKLYTEDSVDAKIKNVFLTGRNLFLENKTLTEANETAYINEVKKLNSPEAEPALFWLSLDRAKGPQNWLEYIRLVMESGDKYIRSSEDKENVSKVIYENMDDKIALEKAEQMMKTAAENDPGWLVYETYANVLYELNRKSEANSMALKALETAKRIGAKPQNYQSIVYLLEKIEKLKP